MSWYKAGAIAVTNGSGVVTSTGTAWVANVQIGHAFNAPDGKVYEVAAVNSDTQITLGSNYLGQTASGQAYSVQPNQGFAQQAAAALASFQTQFGSYVTTALAGRFGDGSAGAPGITFSADQGTGFYRAGTSQMGVVTGGIVRAFFDQVGNVGIGTSAAAAKLHVAGTTANGIYCTPAVNPTAATAVRHLVLGETSTNSNYALRAGYFQDGADGTYPYKGVIDAVAGNTGTPLIVNPSGGNVGIGTSTPTAYGAGSINVHLKASAAAVQTLESGNCVGQSSANNNLGMIVGTTSVSPLILYSNNVERARIDASGNLIVGATSGAQNRFVKTSAEGSFICSFDNTVYNSLIANVVTSQGFSSSGAAILVGRNSSTGRSINAGGTINASGADYAEYMRKAAASGAIAKGDVCGVNADGELVTAWADARWFRIKSTAPNLVGGDGWSAHLGDRPSEPVLALPAYVGPAEPTEPVAPSAPAPLADMPVQPARDEGEDNDAYALRIAGFLVAMTTWQKEAGTVAQASADYTAATETYAAARAQYVGDRAAFDAAQSAYAAAVTAAEADHAAAMTTFATDLVAFETALEAARQTVDRIAYCGQVPVNFAGTCQPGDYLIAVQDGDGIGIAAVAPGSITFEQYRTRLGAVLAIRDGRPLVDVQHG